jgi:predicted HTH domain antitoxin
VSTTAVLMELPDDVIALLGSAEGAATEARRALVLELLREARISQGRAAELLGVTRGQILDLMAERRIPSGPETPEALRDELASLRRYVGRSARDAGNQ